MPDDLFDELEDLPNFYLGAAIGFIEEDLEEERKRERKLQQEDDPIFNPDDEEPYP